MVVVEVKNVPADARAIAQVCRYWQDVKAILDRRGSYDWQNAQGAIILKVVIAPAVESVYNYFEAEACDVLLLEFEVAIHMQVYTAHPEKQADLDRYKTKFLDIDRIALGKEWDMFGQFTPAKSGDDEGLPPTDYQEGDWDDIPLPEPRRNYRPDEYSDIILG